MNSLKSYYKYKLFILLYIYYTLYFIIIYIHVYLPMNVGYTNYIFDMNAYA